MVNTPNTPENTQDSTEKKLRELTIPDYTEYSVWTKEFTDYIEARLLPQNQRLIVPILSILNSGTKPLTQGDITLITEQIRKTIDLTQTSNSRVQQTFSEIQDIIKIGLIETTKKLLDRRQLKQKQTELYALFRENPKNRDIRNVVHATDSLMMDKKMVDFINSQDPENPRNKLKRKSDEFTLILKRAIGVPDSPSGKNVLQILNAPITKEVLIRKLNTPIKELFN